MKSDKKPDLKDYKFRIDNSVGLSKDGTTYDDDVKKYIDHIEQQNKELVKCQELLQRIFNYHISHGFGDNGSFESFADEITDLL